MLGLLKDTDCSVLKQNQFQLHYCGTCKTLGKHYGQASRILLNYDAVFLAELLTVLDSKQISSSWSTPLKAVNLCWVLPRKQELSPLALHYAAACNLLFSHLKFKDNIEDSNYNWSWKSLAFFYKTAFQKALKDLGAWGADLKKCLAWTKEQERREKQAKHDFESLEELLNHYAAATEVICAELFATAANVINLSAQKEGLAALGRAFGKLIYALDALEDYQKDLHKHEFNPLHAYFLHTQKLDDGQLSICMEQIQHYQSEVEIALSQLSISEDYQAYFSTRFSSNLAERLAKLASTALLAASKISFSQSLSQRWSWAKTETQKKFCLPDSFLGRLQGNFISLALFMIPSVGMEEGQGFSWLNFGAILLSVLGFGAVLGQLLPVKPNKKKGKKGRKNKEKSDCHSQLRSSCDGLKAACILCFAMLAAIELILLIVGIILLIKGFIFWGIFSILIFPFLIVLLLVILG